MSSATMPTAAPKACCFVVKESPTNKTNTEYGSKAAHGSTLLFIPNDPCHFLATTEPCPTTTPTRMRPEPPAPQEADYRTSPLAFLRALHEMSMVDSPFPI